MFDRAERYNYRIMPVPPSTNNKTGWTHLVVTFRWPLVFVAVCAIMLLAYMWTVSKGAQTAADIGQSIAGIAERFRTGKITTAFLAAVPELTSTGSGNLEVATASATETFTRSEERRILWDWVSLGETVTEIRAGVTYRYYVSFNDPWDIDVSDHTCMVKAPALRPSLPPAIHTDTMEKRIERGWFRFDAERQMADLEKAITPTLVEYASDPRHLNLVRETARKTVAEFVRRWLLKEDHWRPDRFRAITVIFADEGISDLTSAAPTLQLTY